MPRSIMWFRRDLRLADNPALAAAASMGEVLGLFVVDPRLVDAAGPSRLAFLGASLRALDASMGGALVVRSGDPRQVVPAVAAEVGADEVWAAEDFGPYGRRRDGEVAEAMAAGGGHLGLIDSPYAVAPGRVTKDDGHPYRVFTPFSRAWRATGWPAPANAPDVAWHEAPGEAVPGWTAEADLPVAGEHAAHEQLEDFVAGGLARYDRRRDQPGVEGTSRLSPYLRWGALHPRQILAELGPSKAHTRFATELAWREFYADVLFRHPTSGWENLDEQMEAMPVDTDKAARARFTSWAEARTGYPIVDAGMRQLHATGWMHNRVRMITASFLVKDLHLPWQWGARHFMHHLVDGDLASNSHGWQWTAGTGTDAAPYFRIFNPALQAKRFDPDGAYVRRWLPELDGVADKHLHEPWTSPKGLPPGYPAPVVDHAEERSEALRRYALVTRR